MTSTLIVIYEARTAHRIAMFSFSSLAGKTIAFLSLGIQTKFTITTAPNNSLHLTTPTPINTNRYPTSLLLSVRSFSCRLQTHFERLRSKLALSKGRSTSAHPLHIPCSHVLSYLTRHMLPSNRENRTLKELVSYQIELEENRNMVEQVRASRDHSKLKQWVRTSDISFLCWGGATLQALAHGPNRNGLFL